MVAISHDDAHTKEYLIPLPALNQVYVDDKSILYFSVEQNVTEYNECKNTSIKSKYRTGMPTLLQLKASVQ